MILIALGANLPGRYGAPEDTLKAAMRAIQVHGVRVLRASSIWVSAPVPVSEQPWYRNAVIAVETALDARKLLAVLHDIEHDFGRVRGVLNAPRELDLDLLAYNDACFEEAGLVVPHPRMEGRAFVLYPLREVAPEWRHPQNGRRIEDLVAALPSGQAIERCARLAA